jgi:hypothetical protein
VSRFAALARLALGSVERPDLPAIGGKLGRSSASGPLSLRAGSGPDLGEVITTGAFIAFYSSDELADRHARGLDGEVSRHGKVTVLYVSDVDFPAATDAQRRTIEGCV